MKATHVKFSNWCVCVCVSVDARWACRIGESFGGAG